MTCFTVNEGPTSVEYLKVVLIAERKDGASHISVADMLQESIEFDKIRGNT
jgi:hypothetical protein